MFRSLAMRVTIAYILCLSVVNVSANKANNRLENDLMNAWKTTLEITPMVVGEIFKKHNVQLRTNSSHLEDMNLDVDGLLTKYGFPVEKHQIVTEDGYVLTLFRIPSRGPPVLLMHGLLMSGDDWVTPGPQSGIAYLLSAEGYDVWIGNSRGTKYSRNHMSMSPNSEPFWDFSWSEIGYYDIPAMIDYVLYVTKASRLSYVCHSQGCTVFFVMTSEKPVYNDKIKIMIGLAPVAALMDVKSPLLVLIQHLTNPRPDRAFALLRQSGSHEFLARSILRDSFVYNICGDFDLARIICSSIIFTMCGFSYNQLNLTNLPVVYSHSPSPSATKQLEHYAQTIAFKKFQKFDYGVSKNLELYGSKRPPRYRLDLVSAPVAILHSRNDWLATENNIKYIQKRLKNIVDLYEIPDSMRFNHIDFLHAREVHKFVFPRILKLINKYNNP